MILYHTSTQTIEHPDVLHSRQHLDFGPGFYLTTLREQAERYGERFIRRGEPAVMNIYELDIEIAPFTYKRFDHYDGDFSGIYTREQALDQLQYKQPNHQVCITSQQLIDAHLHHIDHLKLS